MYRAPEIPPAELQYRHEERTCTLQKEERYKAYRQWLIQNGGKVDKIEYPVCYTNSGMLVGIAALKDLDEGEMYMEIPETLTYNRRTVLKSLIGFIVEKHPEIFNKHQEVDLGLVLYTFHEKLKGENSFWAPSFDIMNLSDLPAFWNDENINEFQDQVMIGYAKNYKLQYEEDAYQIFKTLRENNYSEFFPGITDHNLDVKLKELFYWCFNATATRFMQMEYSFKMGCMMSQFDCTNHNQYDDTLYKTVSEGQVIQQFSEGYTLEPWGVADFEYFYSRPLKSIQAQRDSQLIVDQELIEEFKHGAYGNLTTFEEAQKEKPFQHYQIFTQRKIKKGDQIFFNYGRCNNRYWIINYGFPIIGNEYDGFAVHVQIGESQKVTLIFKGKPYAHLIKLAKKQLKREQEAPNTKEIISRAIDLIKAQYTNNFNSNPTSLEDDEKLMKTDLTWRQFICLVYRKNIKEIIHDNITRLQDQFQELSR